MDVETVNGVDTELGNLLGIFRTQTCGSGKDGHVDIFQFRNVVNDLIGCQLQWLVLVTLATDDAGNLKVGCGLQGLHREVTDVAVTDYGCSDFLHSYLFFGCNVL